MGNKLVWGIVGGLIFVVLLVGRLSQGGNEQFSDIAQDEATESADGDTTVTTLETLVAQLKKNEEAREADREELKEQLNRIKDLERQLERGSGQQNEQKVDVEGLRLDIVGDVIKEVGKLRPNQGGEGTWGSNFDEFNGGLNIGDGNGVVPSAEPPPRQGSVVTNASKEGYVVLGALPPKDEESTGFNSVSRSAPQTNKDDEAKKAKAEIEALVKADKEKNAVKPVYTIPQLAQDLKATTLTAVIGRIPNGGQLRDPFFFKAISSSDVVTANGHVMPEIEGVIWEGTAIGDRTLGCIQGKINKVSLILRDGSIAKTNVGGSGENGELGYIADKYGQPCLPGKLISNASNLLAARIGARALEAAAEAEAARFESTVETSSGNVSTTVLGSRSKYIRAKTAASGMSELVAFVRERMADAFDAIYSEPGTTIQIHLQKQVEFDYDPNGRKLTYNQGATNANIYAD